MTPKSMTYVVSAFYKFVDLNDAPAIRDRLLPLAEAMDVRGTILLAPEGINGTISAPAATSDRFLDAIRSETRFASLEVKQAHYAAHPFGKFKIKLKREIITFNQPEGHPAKGVGTYVPPQDWNALIADPDVIVLDTRNKFEVAAGTFARAIDPGIDKFTDFAKVVDALPAEARDKPIATFCTGGIRCEKATAYMKAKGFKHVYHLKGGILAYLEQIPVASSTWHGACVVFDERGGVDHTTYQERSDN